MIKIKYTLTQGMSNTGTHTELTTTTGPRNLVKVAETYEQTKRRLKEAYGNIGCGRVWVEVDGRELGEDELLQLRRQEYELDLDYWKSNGAIGNGPDTPTARAKALLADLAEEAV